jgi:hypothetical protein
MPQPIGWTQRMLKRIVGMTFSYWNVASWLVRDVIRTLRFKLGGQIVLTLAVTLSKVCTFGGFLLFLHGYTSGEPVTIPLMKVSLPSSNLVAWGLLIFTSAAVMGALGYLEARLRVQLASSYAISAMRRALDALSSGRFDGRTGPELSHGFKVRLLAGDSLAMMRAALPILTVILPIIQLIVAAAILFAMSWELAIAIVSLGILYAIPFYGINRWMLAAMRGRPQQRQAFKSAVQNALREIAFPQYRDVTRGRAQDIVFGPPHVYDQFKSFLTVRTTRDAVSFLSSAFLAVFMLILIYYLSLLNSQSALVGIATYGIVLFQAYASANMIAGQVAAFNRFLPQFRRYADVLSQSENTPEAESVDQAPVLRFKASASNRLPGSLPSMMPEPGQVCAVVHPLRLSFRTKEAWLSAIGAGRNKTIRPFLVPAVADMPDLPLRDLIQGGTAAAELPFVAEFVSRLPSGDQTQWRRAVEQMPVEISLPLLVAPALRQNVNVILLDNRNYVGASLECRSAVKALFPNAVWLVNATWPVLLVPEDATQVVLLTDDGIVGLGDREWGVNITESNPDLFKSNAQPDDGKVADDDDDDDVGLDAPLV